MCIRRLFRLGLLGIACARLARGGTDTEEAGNRVLISIRDQKAVLLQNNAQVACYPVSTSKFGLGDRWNSMSTPLGCLQVAQKIGDHAPSGAVFKNRRFTGEILRPDAPGRDPIVTRIIWLRGLERSNANAFNRCIYIHGTPEERLVGKPASYGCIRMRSKDVSALYGRLPLGAMVQIISDKLPKLPKFNPAPTATTVDEAKPVVTTMASKTIEKSKTTTPRKNASNTATDRIVKHA